MPVVQQQDRPRAQALYRRADDSLGALPPIESRVRPHDQAQASLAEHAPESEPADTVRRTKDPGRLPGDFPHRLLSAIDLPGHAAPRPKTEERMGVRVVAERVTLGHDAPHHVGMALHVPSANEERRGDPARAQNIEDLFGERRRGSVVKGQRDALAVRSSSHQRRPQPLRRGRRAAIPTQAHGRAADRNTSHPHHRRQMILSRQMILRKFSPDSSASMGLLV